MDRGKRRYQKLVAKTRRLRIFWNEHRYKFELDPTCNVAWPWHRPWRTYRMLMRDVHSPMSKHSMSGYPKQWDVEMHIRPARIRSNQLLKLIVNGRVGIDSVNFPDYRKPHIYYW